MPVVNRITKELIACGVISESNSLSLNGVELWPYSGIITGGSQWGNLFIDGNRCIKDGLIEIGKAYIVKVEYSGTGSVQLRVGGGYSGVSDGDIKEFTVTASGTRVELVESSSSGTAIGAQLSLSIKETIGP
jgi:hypothetical protein